jgi:hypothetical protein
MASPTHEHLRAALRTICYVKGTMRYRLHFGGFSPYMPSRFDRIPGETVTVTWLPWYLYSPSINT